MNRDKAVQFVNAGKANEPVKPIRVQSWELIGDNLSKAGWSWDWCLSE